MAEKRGAKPKAEAKTKGAAKAKTPAKPRAGKKPEETAGAEPQGTPATAASPAGLGLNTLRPARGATHRRKRIGRGPGSGHGKTAGRGNKGFWSRSGSSQKRGFE